MFFWCPKEPKGGYFACSHRIRVKKGVTSSYEPFFTKTARFFIKLMRTTLHELLFAWRSPPRAKVLYFAIISYYQNIILTFFTIHIYKALHIATTRRSGEQSAKYATVFASYHQKRAVSLETALYTVPAHIRFLELLALFICFLVLFPKKAHLRF